MAYEEKSGWIMAVLATTAYAVYLVVVLTLPGELTERPYAAPMLWTIGGSIVVSILIHIVIGMFSSRVKDQRDREIARTGEISGQAFLVIAAIGALLLALLEADTFWIANAIFLGFVLSAIVGSLARIGFYRVGIH